MVYKVLVHIIIQCLLCPHKYANFFPTQRVCSLYFFYWERVNCSLPMATLLTLKVLA